MKTLALIFALIFLAGCCHRMPEPNLIGKSVRACGDTIQMYSVHSGSWYTCEHKAGVCFSRQEWEAIDLWKNNHFK